MNNYYRPNALHLTLPFLLGLEGVGLLFSGKTMWLYFGIIFISSAYGGGLWLIVDRYVAYWREVNKFAESNPDALWAYLGISKPSTTSRVMVQTNTDDSYPVYDTREVNASEDTMREIAKAYTSGKLQFSEREYASVVGGKVAVRKLQKEFKEAGYIRLNKAGDMSRSYAFTATFARKLQGYLVPHPDMELRQNDG